MRAIRMHGRGGPDHLVYEEVPTPTPGAGELLIRVYATGVITPELTWGATYKTNAGIERPTPIPGHDLSGVVESVGTGVSGFAVGSEVYALTAFDRDGAEAEYAIALPGELAAKPKSLTHVQAAAVPLTALTAWQAFYIHAGLAAGQTVLIHGAAGGVGVFAVQLAHWTGAHVIGTASARNLDFLRELGADEVIDYTTVRFEEVVHDVDVVLDTVGGQTLDRSWGVLKKAGIMVSVAQPPSEEQAQAHSVWRVWFVVEPDGEQLMKIGALIDSGRIKPIIDTELPLAQAQQAYEQGAKGHTRGKIVLRVVA